MVAIHLCKEYYDSSQETSRAWPVAVAVVAGSAIIVNYGMYLYDNSTTFAQHQF